jgi:hypothetical protein
MELVSPLMVAWAWLYLAHSLAIDIFSASAKVRLALVSRSSWSYMSGPPATSSYSTMASVKSTSTSTSLSHVHMALALVRKSCRSLELRDEVKDPLVAVLRQAQDRHDGGHGVALLHHQPLDVDQELCLGLLGDGGSVCVVQDVIDLLGEAGGLGHLRRGPTASCTG